MFRDRSKALDRTGPGPVLTVTTATNMLQSREHKPMRNVPSMNSTAVSRRFQSTPHNDLLRTADMESRKLRMPLSSPQLSANFKHCRVTTNAFENSWQRNKTPARTSIHSYNKQLNTHTNSIHRKWQPKWPNTSHNNTE